MIRRAGARAPLEVVVVTPRAAPTDGGASQRTLLVHAQPIHLTYLSDVSAYRDSATMNARLSRWEPETMAALPEGIEVLGFMVPGSDELQKHNVAGLREHQMVPWRKHGLMARSEVSPTAAVDKTGYAETGAAYEVLDLHLGRIA